MIGSNKLLIGVRATKYHFGVLTLAMHMAWVRAVADRMKSDISYAPTVYSLFPWPDPSPTQKGAIKIAEEKVLSERAVHPDTPLAVLYDGRTMPPALSKANAALDKAVDAAYRRRSFKSEAERVAYLFERYEARAALLAPVPQPVKKGRRVKAPA